MHDKNGAGMTKSNACYRGKCEVKEVSDCRVAFNFFLSLQKMQTKRNLSIFRHCEPLATRQSGYCEAIYRIPSLQKVQSMPFSTSFCLAKSADKIQSVFFQPLQKVQSIFFPSLRGVRGEAIYNHKQKHFK
ncbi:MAG: hypothetical protein LBP54_05125 [Campylobacteraceae bacterium]|nr:hypothetical protein [Campylobacteraceae bacterium]